MKRSNQGLFNANEDKRELEQKDYSTEMIPSWSEKSDNYPQFAPKDVIEGGRPGVTVKPYNNEVQPETMKEQARDKETPMEQKDTDPDLNKSNACQQEKDLLFNCLNDHKDNIGVCQEVMTELKDCQRDYSSRFMKTEEH